MKASVNNFTIEVTPIEVKILTLALWHRVAQDAREWNDLQEDESAESITDGLLNSCEHELNMLREMSIITGKLSEFEGNMEHMISIALGVND